jgi:CheY-like chemotaxis protein/predicted transcriptional regulator
MGALRIRENVLGSFSLDVAKRMLDVLTEHGTSMKKTNLASKAGLNYNVCLKYIQILNGLGWVEVNPEVYITEAGKGVFANLPNVFKGRTRSNTDGSIWPSKQGEKGIEYSWSSCISSSTTQMKRAAPTAASLIDERQTVLENKQKTGNSKKKTIMIVDDEEDIAQTYEHILSSVGYEVSTFIDPRLALHEYVSDPSLYDLLVLDIRMPAINGLQLYQSIKAINPACRAIFVSALDAAREVVSILPGTRAQDIIQKPVSNRQFLTAVNGALVQQ